MTYLELGDIINEMSAEQKAMDVTIFVSGIDEFYPLSATDTHPAYSVTTTADVLDEGHPYLTI